MSNRELKCCSEFSTTRTTMLSRALPYSTLVAGKRMYIFRTTQFRLWGIHANEHSEAIIPFRVQTLAANDYLHHETKTGLCGVLPGVLAVTSRLSRLPDCFKRTMVLYYSTDYLCFRFQYKRLPLHVALGCFPISWENFSHNTRRGHKRSSGRKRCPSPIQTFVAISCCASSKGQS